GQAAVSLASRFDRVFATDASREQIDNAEVHPKIVYRVAPAEESGLERASVDLVTVAQALHWFDLDRFYPEVRRVAATGGVLAAWCYNRLTVEPAVDSVVERYYEEIVGPYWPPERAKVEQGYTSLPFPVEEIRHPEFEMQERWTLAHLVGYLGTWSAAR